MEIHRVAVVGAGAMGTGIAAALSLSGLPVLLKDVDADAALAGVMRIQKLLQTSVQRGKLTLLELEQAMDRITPVSDYKWFNNVDLVIEAALEQIEAKHQVFAALDAVCPPHAILATNTSSLSISWIASATRRPGQVVGMHFFNPAHVMKLVEVVAGLDTTPETVGAVFNLCQRMKKLPVRVEECAAFLVNRLLGRYSSEALFILMDGVAGPEEIDQAARDFNMPMGPIALRDFTGIDIGYHVSQFNYSEYGPRFEPPALLERMFHRGWLGRKSGRGFYVYGDDGSATGVNPELMDLLKDAPRQSEAFDVRRLFLPMINEAFLVLQEHVVRPADLDPALCAGLGMRRGPLQLAEGIGLAECVRLLEFYFARYGERFRPAPLLKRLVWAKRTLVIG